MCYYGLVNGEWSDWAAWSTCDCAGQSRDRVHTCNNPAPDHWGRPCDGADNAVEACECGKSINDTRNVLIALYT